MIRLLIFLCLASFLYKDQAGAAEPVRLHALAMHGSPALPADFSHFPYANPNAPKGGRLTLGVLGTFDSLNPFIVKGVSVPQVRGYVIESLMARGYDEPFTLYGLIAQSVETDAERSVITFFLNPAARFSDGHPVTAEDVLFSFELLRDKGRPNHRTYYRKVQRVEILSPHSIRFRLGSADRELAMIVALLPVLPRHATVAERFEETSFNALIGSGPYRISEVRAGESVMLRRTATYWGEALAVNRGLWNFDEIKIDFYRDSNTHFEAFRKGLFDLRPETDPGRWQMMSEFSAVKEGRLIADSFSTALPQGMSGFVFNTRRPVFSDPRVRQALVQLFDSEWINQNLFFGRYRRTGSYFQGSELASTGHPADARERALLAQAALPEDIMQGRWTPPVTDGTGRNRAGMGHAVALLGQAGYTLDQGVMRSAEGVALGFEILVATKDQERLALSYAQHLRRAGIDAQVRLVDAVQYERRRQSFDFDMIQNLWAQSLSPGNEQAFYWSSAAARQEGSRNYMGVQNPVIDAVIDAMLAAESREEFVSCVRALDRLLLAGHYVVPLFHLPEQWVARWSSIRHPQATSAFGYVPESWWRSP